MREYYVVVKYFRSNDDNFIVKSESDDLKIIENKIKKIVQNENDMMEVKEISYEMKSKNIYHVINHNG